MFSETVVLRGHIIDSLILPKVLDQILTQGGDFKIGEIKIGQNRVDQSFARIEVSAPTSEALDALILRLRQHGAETVERADVQLAKAPEDGVFPTDFYVTTNQQTFVRFEGKDVEVRPAMMDSAIALDRQKRAARAVKFFDVNQGDEIVVGHQGIRVVPVQRSTAHTDIFQFINRWSTRTNRSQRSFASWVRNCDAPVKRKVKSPSWADPPSSGQARASTSCA